MSAKNITAHARIQVLLEVDAPGTYGKDWKLDSLMKQGTEEALSHLQAVIQRGSVGQTPYTVRIVGCPKIVEVIMRETT